MQTLKISSAFSAGRAYARRLPPLNPAVSEPAFYNERSDDLELGYDSSDDTDAPALTSDDATAPSSSHPPSPSLSPVEENAYVHIVSSSPLRDSLARLYPRRPMLEEKPGTREDAAAALLSLAFPRVGTSPHVNSFPTPPIQRPDSPTVITSSRTTTSALTSSLISTSLDSAPEKSVAPDHLLVHIDPTQEPGAVICDDVAPSPHGTPLRAFSPLPPSSPFSEDPNDTDEDTEDLRLSQSRPFSPPSRLSSPIFLDALDFGSEPSHHLKPLPPVTGASTAQRALPALLPPQVPTMSPLSSPPSSPFMMAVQFPENPVKRKSADAPVAPVPPRKKRRHTSPDEDEENIPVRTDAATFNVVQKERRRRNRSDGRQPQAAHGRKKHNKQTIYASNDAHDLSADSPSASSSDRSDVTCPHPSLLSLIVEAFALSRATSLGSSALYDSISAQYPALALSSASDSAEVPLSVTALEAVLMWGVARGMFDALRSSGDGLPPTFFYLPSADWDKERRDLYFALGGRGTRTVKRAYKQYYWKPVILPRSGGRVRRSTAEDEVKRGWDVDWEE
ncbi:hypothetical protein K488DRAFT_85598 [Vararia minispora EC-137]|uniref:Uncharacterized protein n=1 Tax=Vararia minispora EC-137 TaxID=1314806 RepID=A0ACB8QLI8_9AGAM|nr:hypothetical protein K488DRAFT_85598 [Vararia minispora EC-137]